MAAARVGILKVFKIILFQHGTTALVHCRAPPSVLFTGLERTLSVYFSAHNILHVFFYSAWAYHSNVGYWYRNSVAGYYCISRGSASDGTGCPGHGSWVTGSAKKILTRFRLLGSATAEKVQCILLYSHAALLWHWLVYIAYSAHSTVYCQAAPTI